MKATKNKDKLQNIKLNQEELFNHFLIEYEKHNTEIYNFLMDLKQKNPEKYEEEINRLFNGWKKESDEQNEIKKEKEEHFIFDDKELEQNIDHAIGTLIINGEPIRYFGSMLPEKYETKDKLTGIRDVPVIITEKRKIYSEKLKPTGVKFSFATKMTLKKQRWDKNEIKNFIYSGANFDYVDVFNNFLKIYQENMVFENPIDYEFNVIWDMLTYHQDLIDKALIIKKEGISGSAKSKGMKISSNISFNGRKWVKPNPANFFRYRNKNKSTIYIEEAERLFDETKKKQNGDDELVEYLNASYEKGNFVPRQNKENPDLTDEFDPFGFTQIGAIKPIKGALNKRSITQIHIKAKKTDNRGNTEIEPEHNSLFVSARSKMYIASLLNYKLFLKNLEEVKNNSAMSNREWVLSKPIIALAKCIDNTLAIRIEEYLASNFKIRDENIEQNSWEEILAEALIKKACINKPESYNFYSIFELKQSFDTKLRTIDPEAKLISSNALSRILADLGLKNFRGRNSGGSDRGLTISFFKLCEILVRNEKVTIQEIVKNVSDVSNCQISVDKLHKWFTDTFTDINNNNASNNKNSDALTHLTHYSGGTPKKIEDFEEFLNHSKEQEADNQITTSNFSKNDYAENSSKDEITLKVNEEEIK